MILGRARAIVDRTLKIAALRTLVNRVLPGRWDEARPPTDNELKATVVLSVALAEASAKVRSGPPQDDRADRAFAVWAGEIPLRMVALDPVPDPLLAADLPPSRSVESFFDERVAHVRILA